MPVALRVDWDAIKQSALAGVPIPDLAARYGIQAATVRKRSERERWALPQAILRRAQLQLKEARKAQLAQLEKRDGVTESLVTAKLSDMSRPVSETPLDVAAESIATYGERSRLAILAGMTPQIASAMAQPEAFRPKNVKELVQVGAMIHKLSGLDQSGNVAVSLNLWSDPARSNPALSGELYEVQDAQDVESEVIQPE